MSPKRSLAPWQAIILYAIALLFYMLLPIIVWPVIGVSIPFIPLWALAFYWGLYRHETHYALMILLMGIAQDIILLLPLGSSSVIGLSTYMLLQHYRHLFLLERFVAVWLVFGALLCFIFPIQALIVTYIFAMELSDILINWWDDALGSWLMFAPTYMMIKWLLHMVSGKRHATI